MGLLDSNTSPMELVEILKRLARHERELDDRIKRLYEENEEAEDPDVQRQCDALDEDFANHPLGHVATWVEQRTGLSRHDVEELGRRLLTVTGAQPKTEYGPGLLPKT